MDEKDQQVTAAIRQAEAAGEVVTVTAIAEAAGVRRSYLYQRPALITRIQALDGGRRSRNQQVTDALRDAEAAGEVITVEGIARKAGVDKKHIYRHRELLAAIEQAGEPTMADRDKRSITVTVRVSPYVLALIRGEIGEDVPEAQFIWDAVVETLAGRLGVDTEDVDPVRRTARRRRNYTKRAAKEQGR